VTALEPHVPEELQAFFAQPSERLALRQAVKAAPRAARATEYLVFEVGGERCALPIEHVQEICRLPAITRVPRVGPGVLGIMTLRGAIVPVVDLGVVLSLRPRPEALARANRIVVLAESHGALGLRVDNVRGVERISAPAVQARPYALMLEHPELVTALGHGTAGLLTVLDGEALLRHLDRLS
jgi:purine-binding chemotaxis protein CheW